MWFSVRFQFYKVNSGFVCFVRIFWNLRFQITFVCQCHHSFTPLLYDAGNEVLPCWIAPTNCQPKPLRRAEVPHRAVGAGPAGPAAAGPMLRRIYIKWNSWWNGAVLTDICGLKLNEICHHQMRLLSLLWDLLRPKSVCGRGSAPDPAGWAYSAPPNPLAGGEGAPKNPTSALSPLGLALRPFGPQA